MTTQTYVAKNLLMVVLLLCSFICITTLIFLKLSYIGYAIAGFVIIKSLYYLSKILISRTIPPSLLDTHKIASKENTKPLFALFNYQIAIYKDIGTTYLGSIFSLITWTVFFIIFGMFDILSPSHLSMPIIISIVVIYFIFDTLISKFLHSLRVYRL